MKILTFLFSVWSCEVNYNIFLSQYRDDVFAVEEGKFRAVEKGVKVFLRNVMNYMDRLQVVFFYMSIVNWQQQFSQEIIVHNL